MIKSKTVCLLGLLLVFQGCGRGSYALLPGTTESFHTAGTTSGLEKPTSANLFAFNSEPGTDFHAELSGNKLETQFPQNPIEVSGSSLHPIPVVRKNNYLDPIHFQPESQLVNSSKKALIIESQLGTIVYQAKSKRLNKLLTSPKNPLQGEGYVIFVLFGLGALLVLLIMSSLSALAIIGLMLGAVLLSLIFLFFAFVSGGFGKIGG